jgi:hypothetical protein
VFDKRDGLLAASVAIGLEVLDARVVSDGAQHPWPAHRDLPAARRALDEVADSATHHHLAPESAIRTHHTTAYGVLADDG